MPLFFEPNLKNTNYLNQEESYHCYKVLRLKKGSIIHITDGKGLLVKAKLNTVNSTKCQFTMIEKKISTSNGNPFIHIAIAPPKNSKRMEWFVEKSTEIGISEITPIICKNSLRKSINKDRLQKTAIAAMKQSRQVFLPIISPITNFEDFVAKKLKISCYIAWKDLESKDFYSLQNIGNSALILIGPEGDFSKDEIVMALAGNYIPVSLGKNILRTETAGIVACLIVNLINQKKV